MQRRRIRARQLLFTAVILGLALWLLVPGGALVQANGAGPVYLPVVYRQPTPTPDPGWRFEYFNNPGLTAPVVYTTYEMSQFVEKEWGTGGPGNGVNPDYFSARVSRTLWFDAGSYQFAVTADDGARLYVDGALVIDIWSGSVRGTHSGVYERTFPASGYHEIRCEYNEYFGDARVRLFWTNLGQFPAWRAEYWNNETMSGDPVVVRNEDSLQIDWGNGAPAGVNGDNFSARFRRAIYMPDDGLYVFSLMADDGCQLWIDTWASGQAVIDKYSGASGQTNSTAAILPKGWYVLTVTFREITGGARLNYWHGFGGTFNEYGYRGKYYNNDYLGGTPLWEQDDGFVPPNGYITKDTSGWVTAERFYYNYGTGAPTLKPSGAAPLMPADYFSVTWTHAFQGHPGTYLFTTQVDDGFRLWVDGQLVRDAWLSAGQVHTNSIYLSGDWHVIRMDYHDVSGNAYVDLKFARQP